jgi:hypothetical protein
LILHEVIHELQSKKLSDIIKLDFEKAYDKVLKGGYDPKGVPKEMDRMGDAISGGGGKGQHQCEQ